MSYGFFNIDNDQWFVEDIFQWFPIDEGISIFSLFTAIDGIFIFVGVNNIFTFTGINKDYTMTS